MNEAQEVAELLEAHPLKKHWYKRISDNCNRLDATFERLDKTPEYRDFQKAVTEFEQLLEKIKAEVKKGKRPRPK